MDQKIYHGDIKPKHIADAFVAQFNRGNWRTQVFGDDENLKIQIATRSDASSGGQTAVTIAVQKTESGIAVQIGQQEWMGVAASLGQSALATLMNPWNLLGRLDDIAQDIENLQMVDSAWQLINNTVKNAGISLQLSERMQSIACNYCGTANQIADSNCISCGAPMGNTQPKSCNQCGFIVFQNEPICPNCKSKI